MAIYENDSTVVRSGASDSILTKNKVLKNTYFLLSLTLIFSGAISWFAVVSNAPYLGFGVSLIGMFGLMFLTQALRNSPWGIAATFAFTGFMGYTLGPLINSVIHGYSNGGQIVGTALGATGVIFLALSAYVLTTKKDFSYIGGFLFCGLIAVFGAILVGVFYPMPALQLIIAAAMVLISSGFILFQTSLIINGGERNYIMATISLYVSIYNLFVSLLQLFSAFSGRN